MATMLFIYYPFELVNQDKIPPHEQLSFHYKKGRRLAFKFLETEPQDNILELQIKSTQEDIIFYRMFNRFYGRFRQYDEWVATNSRRIHLMSGSLKILKLEQCRRKKQMMH